MTVEFTLRRLGKTEARPPFDCGDSDLNEFFSEDSITHENALIAVTYVAEFDGSAVGFYCVSNDSIKTDGKSITAVMRELLLKKVPSEKRYPGMPAVKIGRLAVCNGMRDKGIGTDMLDYVKASFTVNNKTGCRFIIVDAYNDTRVLKFYEDNDFTYLLRDKKKRTRLMYYDLVRFVR